MRFLLPQLRTDCSSGRILLGARRGVWSSGIFAVLKRTLAALSIDDDLYSVPRATLKPLAGLLLAVLEKRQFLARVGPNWRTSGVASRIHAPILPEMCAKRRKSSARPGACRLCHKETALSLSHIIPDFFHDHSSMMFPTGNQGNPLPFSQPISTTPGVRFARKQHGFYERRHGFIERLLCQACEQQFSKLEDYAKRFFYGSTSPIRIQLQSSPKNIYHADYNKLKLFQMSLLWRAVEARGEFFTKVSLKDSQREMLRIMLFEGNPGAAHDFGCSMSRFIVPNEVLGLDGLPDWSMESFIGQPASRKHEGYSSHQLVMGALGWFFFTPDEKYPEEFLGSLLQVDGSFALYSDDGLAFLRQFSRRVIAAGNITARDVVNEKLARIPPATLVGRPYFESQ